jgi:tripartite-type tricarboxylate transporter receptor subunit TctC
MALPRGASAQSYPSKPVKLIVPFGAGTGVDVTSRIFAQYLSEETKGSFVVENRDGAGGIIGTMAGAKSAPDGYTLMFVSAPITSAHLLQPDVTYDPIKDFKPIARVVTNPLTIVAGKDQPFKTFQEMIAYMKANPGKVQYATSGKGSSSHLETELITQRYGVKAIDIPYKAFGPAITDVIAGRVSFFLSALSALLPHIKAGSVIALANSTPQRSPVIPDVPTFAELYGEPGWEGGVWYGVLAPIGTPDDVVNYVSEKIKVVMANPALKAKVEGGGSQLSYMPAAAFTKLISEDVVKWGKVIESLGLKQLKS